MSLELSCRAYRGPFGRPTTATVGAKLVFAPMLMYGTVIYKGIGTITRIAPTTVFMRARSRLWPLRRKGGSENEILRCAFRMTRRSRVALPALLVLLIALLAWGLWPVTVLEIRAGEGGQVLKSLPVSPGDRVVYSYVHSVQKTRVDEILEVSRAGGLVVREAVYDMTGAGLPSDLPDGDFSLDPSTGKYRITNMSRKLPIFRVRVAFTAEQTLEVGGEKLRLDSLSEPTTLLVVEATNRPRVMAMLSR